jgi:aryl-alcohol dehydrogenase-like predicted oxidoreductase
VQTRILGQNLEVPALGRGAMGLSFGLGPAADTGAVKDLIQRGKVRYFAFSEADAIRIDVSTQRRLFIGYPRALIALRAIDEVVSA